MADSERHLLAPSEKETLEDVLKYGSTADVARLQHISAETVRLFEIGGAASGYGCEMERAIQRVLCECD